MYVCVYGWDVWCVRLCFSISVMLTMYVVLRTHVIVYVYVRYALRVALCMIFSLGMYV